MKEFYEKYWELIDPSAYAVFATIAFYIWTTLL